MKPASVAQLLPRERSIPAIAVAHHGAVALGDEDDDVRSSSCDTRSQA